MVMAFISLVNTVFSYYDVDLPILSYIGGYSILTILFLYLASYVVVDAVVRINGNDITLQKLPANLDVADQGTVNGALVITTSREAMNAEVDSMRQKSISILNSVDYHKKIVQDCEVLLQRLNPEFAEQKQQKQEIDMLKSQMSEMMSGMKELMAQLKSKEDATKS